MKKIMFNDKYGLTQAVLDERKTNTRRVIKSLNDADSIDSVEVGIDERGKIYFTFYIEGKPTQDIYPQYQVGEEVAVAQSYFDTIVLHDGSFSGMGQTSRLLAHPGAKNKMFVKAECMPRRIRITNVRVERLQDISDEDCLNEGIYESLEAPYNKKKYGCYNSNINASSPREAFAALIDKTCGKGTWDGNPWVFVYEFELVK